jgi:hypothetical protein
VGGVVYVIGGVESLGLDDRKPISHRDVLALDWQSTPMRWLSRFREAKIGPDIGYGHAAVRVGDSILVVDSFQWGFRTMVFDTLTGRFRTLDLKKWPINGVGPKRSSHYHTCTLAPGGRVVLLFGNGLEYLASSLLLYNDHAKWEIPQV